MSVIPAAPQAEVRGSQSEVSPDKNIRTCLGEKKERKKERNS
jgi:hypothetical protein